MALQLLPSFQSFLEASRAPAPLSLAGKSLLEHQGYRRSYASLESPSSPGMASHPAARMYQLAALTAREYEKALRSPLSTGSSEASSPRWMSEDSEASSDEERLLAAARERSPSSRAQAGAASNRALSPTAPYRNKKKYLKEKQRCEIVRRVRAGEKQAHLAKEFGVSRAAVCYLLKHQTEILSRSHSAASAV